MKTVESSLIVTGKIVKLRKADFDQSQVIIVAEDKVLNTYIFDNLLADIKLGMIATLVFVKDKTGKYDNCIAIG